MGAHGDQQIKRTLAKNNSHGNLNKLQHFSQSRDVGGSNVKEISYVATNMPNSLQENAMEQLASPTAANNAYAGLKTLSHRNSE